MRGRREPLAAEASVPSCERLSIREVSMLL
jgi:hypothetical protein